MGYILMRQLRNVLNVIDDELPFPWDNDFTDDYMVANYDMVPADKVTEEDEKRLKGCFAGDWYVYKVSFATGNEKLLEEELNEQKQSLVDFVKTYSCKDILDRVNGIISQSNSLNDRFNVIESYLESIDAVLVDGEDIMPRSAAEDENDIESWDEFKRYRWMTLFWGGASSIRRHKRTEGFPSALLFLSTICLRRCEHAPKSA